MTEKMVYFDHNATTPLHPEVVKVMTEAMHSFGNPSSLHAYGREAHAHVEAARESIASFIGANPEEVVFIGQSVPIQVILTDPTGKSVRGLTRVQITSEGFMTDTTTYRQRRETQMINGKPTSVLSQDMHVTPIKEGELELRAQGQAILQPQPGQAFAYQV